MHIQQILYFLNFTVIYYLSNNRGARNVADSNANVKNGSKNQTFPPTQNKITANFF